MLLATASFIFDIFRKPATEVAGCMVSLLFACIGGTNFHHMNGKIQKEILNLQKA